MNLQKFQNIHFFLYGFFLFCVIETAINLYKSSLGNYEVITIGTFAIIVYCGFFIVSKIYGNFVNSQIQSNKQTEI